VFISAPVFRGAARARTEHEVRLNARAESDDTFWFVALAKEQTALITDDWFHGIPFVAINGFRFQRLAMLLLHHAAVLLIGGTELNPYPESGFISLMDILTRRD